MKYTFVINNHLTDNRLKTEHGLCIYLEANNVKILLDTGSSPETLSYNAQILGINLASIDYVFLSHGHRDHTGGLEAVINKNHSVKIIASKRLKNTRFYSERNNQLKDISTPIDLNQLHNQMIWIEDGEEKIINNFIKIFGNSSNIFPKPKANKNLKTKLPDSTEILVDSFEHELIFSVTTDDATLIFTGCCHNGILNILKSANEKGIKNITHIVGGFHLLDPRDGQTFESDDELLKIATFLQKNYPQTKIETCHCTGENAMKFFQQKH